MSYARYLLSVREGRLLSTEEEADHIDDDRLHDAKDNLQVLSKEENAKKYAQTNPPTMLTFECSECGETFERRRNKSWAILNKGQKPFCSRKCLHNSLKGG
jgi:hypothetical protein